MDSGANKKAVKRFIAIAGNVGVGKSSLTTLLADRLGWTPFFEAVEDNPYLPDFYADMRSWSFHSQIFFLTRRLRHHREIMEFDGSVIQDRTVYEDAQIFARNLYLQGNMTRRDWESYCALYDELVEFLPSPDLVIYLRGSDNTLIDRIRMRGRAYEQDIQREYLIRLNNLYESWIAEFTLSPVLIVPADALDFVAHPAHLDLIISKIQDKLAGKEEVFFLREELAKVNDLVA